MLPARLEKDRVSAVYDRLAPVYDLWALVTETRARNLTPSAPISCSRRRRTRANAARSSARSSIPSGLIAASSAPTDRGQVETGARMTPEDGVLLGSEGGGVLHRSLCAPRRRGGNISVESATRGHPDR